MRLSVLILVLAGWATYAQAQKVAVIDTDLRESDSKWNELYEKAGGVPPKLTPGAEIRIYDLARPDEPPKDLSVGISACAAFQRNGAELAVASHSKAVPAMLPSTTVQFFDTSTGKELRSFVIPDFWMHGIAGTRLYEPHPLIRIARVSGTSQFVLLGKSESSPRVGQVDESYSGERACAVAVFDSERLLGTTALRSTSSLFATFPASTVPAEGALIASMLVRKTGYVQQLSVCFPNDPRRPGTLLTELPNEYAFTVGQNMIYGWGSHFRLLRLPSLSPLLAKESISPETLKPAKDVPENSSSLKLLPRGKWDILAFNALSEEGGVLIGPVQMLVIRIKDGEVQLGPKISDHFFDASISSNGKRLVIVSKDSPQLRVFSLPDLRPVTSIDTVMPIPSQVVVE